MRRLFSTVLGLLCTLTVWGQVTTEGREFWLGFMENQDGNVQLEIYLSAKEETKVRINAPLNSFDLEVDVVPGESSIVQIPTGTFMPTEEGIFPIGLHVTSDKPISVYALNKRSFSADAAVILPINALGKEYYVTAHYEPDGDRINAARESNMIIVGVQDGSEVEIIPSTNTYNGLIAGESTVVTLNAGEVYHIKADGDLTGTYVRSVSSDSDDCKNIAVFGGNVFTNVGGCGDARDHLLEQMFPVSTWGKNFMFIPYESRFGGDYVKIIAAEDGTEVNISGESVINLDAGEYYINKALSGVRTVTSNKPISFAQFSRSRSCDNTQSDPFYILVSPLEQRINKVTFNAFDVEVIDRYYLTLITEAGATNNIFLDGSSISNRFIQVGNAAYASIQISRGNHTLEAEEGVIAFVYGYGDAESFGYSAGVALENLNLKIEGDDEFISVIQDKACLNAEIEFSASFITPAGEQPRFNTFQWDFGNGDTAEGESVTYRYNQPGEYEVVLLASDGQGSCGTAEVVIKQLTVLETEFEKINGPASVCPDVTGIEYTAVGDDSNTYEWSIEGGTITSSTTGKSITVNWGAANDQASLTVTSRNSLGCVGDTIKLPVIINKRLEPALPQSDGTSDTEVCYDDRNRVRYFTPQTNGSQYQWFVQGGTITPDSNPTANEVFINWGNGSGGKVWYREYNPAISDCEGFSDQLEVVVYSPLQVTANIDDVLCFGESTGDIALNITGGKPGAYTVNWDNGLTGAQINNLVAGDYIATITDELGCVLTETFTVAEPDELRILDQPVTLPVRCFQEANGVADITVTGGVTFANGDYEFTWIKGNTQTTTNSHVNTNLRAGTYHVIVTDKNGCQVSTGFTITEPPLLEPDLESLINDPICPQATNGTAYIDAKGGTPDYQFYWSNNPTTDDANASGLSQGSYNVRIVDANGCETSLTIDVTERFPKIFFPNAFSPNGDGANDTFKPVADCSLKYSMQIYNKWGTVVFSTEDLSEGWDGNYNGAEAPAGNYSYIVFYAGRLNEVSFEETYRGSFKLVR